MVAKPYLIMVPTPDEMPARTLVNGVEGMVVMAGSSADAVAMCKAQFEQDQDVLWGNATVTEIVADTNLHGWALDIIINNVDGTLKGHVTVAADGTADAAVKAAQVLTSSANYIGEAEASKALVSSADYGDTETVTLDGKVYTFRTTIGVLEGSVLRGAGEAATMANLVSAITHVGGVAGVNYVTAAVHPSVTAASDGVHTVTITALAAGVAGNSIAVSETCATAAFAGGATALSGGTDSETVTIGSNVYTFQNTLTNVAGHVKVGVSETATIANLHHAINASGGTSGVDYAAATVAHPSVTAVDNGSHTVTVTAILGGVAGNSIATTETAANASWGAVTLAGGEDADTFDTIANAAVTALNAAGFGVTHAVYNASTNVLSVAGTADNLGDHTLVVHALSADRVRDVPVPGALGAIVHQGSAGAALTVALGADNYSIPIAAAGVRQIV